MTDAAHEPSAPPWHAALPRRVLAALAATALAGVLAAIVLGGGAGSSSGRAHGGATRAATRSGARGALANGAHPPAGAAVAPSRASAGAHALTLPPPAGSGAARGGRAVSVAEQPDPLEASSYPAPAGARHAAATAPAKAGEAIVAAGAPSDAEVRAELKQMQAAESAALRAQQQRLAPVAGGSSIGGDGTIPIPANVPEAVQRVVAGANAIADFPYVFGGGHASFVDNAYDCSGSVSYALAAGGLLSAPETSGELESWGAPGPGRYITVLANAGHTYMYVDGVMFNTAGRSGTYASRWQLRTIAGSGFVARHWPGL